MRDVIIADTSCLILFHKIGELDILKKIYKKVIVTPEIAEEFLDRLPNWIVIKKGRRSEISTIC